MKRSRKLSSPLDRVTKICVGFPEAVAAAVGSHWDFRVRNKPFAYYLDNHHDDGRVAIWQKTARGENIDWIKSDPKRFFMPPYVGPRGWVGLRVDVNPVPWKIVEDIIGDSYRLTAPKRLISKTGDSR